MPISRPSASSALASVALLLAGPSLAQQTGKERIEREGDAAMERLKGSIGRAKPEAQSHPSPIPPAQLPLEMRRRAFDGLKQHKVTPDIETRARAGVAAGEAQLAAQREAMAKRLRQSLGLEPSDVADVAKAAAPTPTGWVPVLFVSSSMPLPVLRAYAAQLERARGVMAFRGMPGGMRKVAPMAKLTAQILRLDPGCEGPTCAMRDVQVIVDPLVFRQHGVARVPALAMIPGDPTQPYCERDADSPRARHLIYGDAALDGLLDEYRRLGGAAEVRDAQTLLAIP
ncbi:type-F conjugative transfer system pilin assembly protein TrbC [Sphingomonas sp. MG17]|uniref:Type-F conjugative transfer system pilin assembly protein TrbC n=1 Tax=Sphingomonas tagetis TaxID=2949092 RepID=A0A9X2KRF9_9SPHN|nr:type-F conjugative transfer system pilin assembly protein TrbC [Sphingomonas tagetis]MCP3732748.1 type-F conjugative transfer system pilin assembly protein TrbC [Sphingomonas tagetis]